MVVVVNAMAVTLPINGQSTAEVCNKYINLLIPANITYMIWSFLYLALLAFIGYQLWLAFSGQHRQELTQLITRIRSWWLVSCLANAGWLFAWHYEKILLAALIMLLLLISLAAIHQNFAIASGEAPLREKLFVHVPFSLYLGWASIVFIMNISALAVSWGWHGQGISQVTWVVLMVVLGTLSAVYMILQHNNIIYALVNVWAFYGLILKRSDADVMAEHAIVQACVIAIGVIAIAISWQLYRRQPADA